MKKTGLAALAVITLVHGQASATGGLTNADAGMLISTTVAAVALPLTTLGVGIYAIVTTTRADAENAEAAEAYLRTNATQLRVDLTTGDGPVLRELAQAAEISTANYALFAGRLRAARAELLDLSSPAHLDAERAMRFMARVGELVREDATLSADYEAFRVRHGFAG